MIPVAEIFGPTIQGEGPKVGIKTLFVRVTGCDFSCEWCDSKFAWTVTDDTIRYEPEVLLYRLMYLCDKTKTSNIILTGGNPCLYDFTYIITELNKKGITVDVETQGSKFPDWVKLCEVIVISPKAPSSKQPDVFDNVEKFIKDIDPNNRICIKIPVFNDKDFEFAQKYYNLVTSSNSKNIEMYLSVGNDDVTEKGDISKRILNNYEELINKVMGSDMERVFILPQVHTLVWGNKQGV